MLSTDRDATSGETDMKTYTAQVGPDNAARLAVSDDAGNPLIEDIGEGTVRINELDRLRTRAPDADGAITDDTDGLQIWLDGESYPIFDDLDVAVADAMGAQTHYDESKLAFDRDAALRATAMAKVVELAGSPQAAAGLLGIDEAAVTAIAAATPPSPAVAPPGHR